MCSAAAATAGCSGARSSPSLTRDNWRDRWERRASASRRPATLRGMAVSEHEEPVADDGAAERLREATEALEAVVRDRTLSCGS